MHPLDKHQRDRRLTKDAEREWLEKLAAERQARTPERITPNWLVTAWRKLLS
jgi:hypothetical protein